MFTLPALFKLRFNFSERCGCWLVCHDSLERSLICLLVIIRLENSPRDFENLFVFFLLFSPLSLTLNTFPQMRSFCWGEGNVLHHSASARRRWHCNRVQGYFIGEGQLQFCHDVITKRSKHTRAPNQGRLSDSVLRVIAFLIYSCEAAA